MKHPRPVFLLIALVLSLCGSGCISHAVHIEPITLAPIQMTVDVNVHSDRADEEHTSGSEHAPTEGAPVTPR